MNVRKLESSKVVVLAFGVAGILFPQLTALVVALAAVLVCDGIARLEADPGA